MPRWKAKPAASPRAEEGAPAWLVTYGDMITLVLCFFVLLFSISSLEQAQFEEAAGSLRKHLGYMPEHQTQIKTETVTDVAEPMRGFRWDVPIIGREARTVQITGNRVTIGGKVAFDEGDWRLKEEIKPILDRLADKLRGTRGRIEVRGHANKDEARGIDDMDLSYRRARAVRDYLIIRGVEARSFRVGGVSYFHSVKADVSGDPPPENRRVDIIRTEDMVY